MGADCKSAGSAFRGSNPLPATIKSSPAPDALSYLQRAFIEYLGHTANPFCRIREIGRGNFGEFVLKNLSFISKNKSSVLLLVLALIVVGVGAQAAGLLNTKSGGYLICVNSKTKVVTHPGTSKCPKGSKKLVLGARGVAGPAGLTGATGLTGKDGIDGKEDSRWAKRSHG